MRRTTYCERRYANEHRLTHKFSADEPCDGHELGRNSAPRIHHDRLLERLTADPPRGRRPAALDEHGACAGIMTDPISRLQFTRQEIDRVFGNGYAAAHPEVVVAVMQTAASDFAALAVANAIQSVAAALLEPDGIENGGSALVRPHGLLTR